MKFAKTALFAGAAAFALSTAVAEAASTGTLSLHYAGSARTVGTTQAFNDLNDGGDGTGFSAGGITAGAGYVQNPNLVHVDLADPAFHTPDWYHVYNIKLQMASDVNTEAFRLAIFDVTAVGNIKLSTGTNLAGNNDKYFPMVVNGGAGAANNQAEFNGNSDAGVSFDGLGIVVNQTTAARAYINRVGGIPSGNVNVRPDGGSLAPQQVPTPIGAVVVQYLTPGPLGGLLAVTPLAGGNNFSFFTANDATNNFFTTQTFGLSGDLELVPNDVPEPASLGVLALGGLALLARRRKTA